MTVSAEIANVGYRDVEGVWRILPAGGVDWAVGAEFQLIVWYKNTSPEKLIIARATAFITRPDGSSFDVWAEWPGYPANPGFGGPIDLPLFVTDQPGQWKADIVLDAREEDGAIWYPSDTKMNVLFATAYEEVPPPDWPEPPEEPDPEPVPEPVPEPKKIPLLHLAGIAAGGTVLFLLLSKVRRS